MKFIPIAAVMLAAFLPSCGEDAVRVETSLPGGFLWGTANSPWQAEGRNVPGGGTIASNWSIWEDMGNIPGPTNLVGCGFYDNYAADLALAAADGQNAIRIGVEWARIEPQRGVFDMAVLDHYAAVIDEAKSLGLQVFVTLYHWVVPPWVADPQTGLDAFDVPMNTILHDDFELFVRQVAIHLGGRVDFWVTFNEPFSVLSAGYLAGQHPPGKFADIDGATRYLINVLFMHARARTALMQEDTTDTDGDGFATRVGIAKSANPFDPKDPSNIHDIAGTERINYIFNQLVPNALVHGFLDVDLDTLTTNTQTVPPEGHYPELQGTLDYMGLNYYGPVRVLGEVLPGLTIGPPLFGVPLLTVDEYDPSLPHNGLGREINADGLRRTLVLYEPYGLPIYILENGTDTSQHPQRARYIVEHIEVIRDAYLGGLDIRGYFQWSLTDNFEWTEGYSSHFGLHAIDPMNPAGPRVPTNGVAAYRDIIRHNGSLPEPLRSQHLGGGYPSGTQAPR